eukprot:SAG22_NODE_41_length_25488_cov_6.133719_17_plen_173_part_00
MVSTDVRRLFVSRCHQSASARGMERHACSECRSQSLWGLERRWDCFLPPRHMVHTRCARGAAELSDHWGRATAQLDTVLRGAPQCNPRRANGVHNQRARGSLGPPGHFHLCHLFLRQGRKVSRAARNRRGRDAIFRDAKGADPCGQLLWARARRWGAPSAVGPMARRHIISR